MTSVGLTLDRAVGGAVGRVWTWHHRRRLRRVGWDSALDADTDGWVAGDPAPRAGCALEVLVDGAVALPRMAAEIRAARSRVHIAGWFFSPEFALVRDAEPVVLRNLLAEVAERAHVRVIAWAGAPVPVFRPARGSVRRMRATLTDGTRIQCVLDARERPLHCHHEKTIVVDDRVAFVGGIDLTLLAGDRYDTNAHPDRAAVGWHDIAVRLEGPAVADVAAHFAMRWHELTDEDLGPVDPVAPTGPHEVQIVRTVPERIYRRVPRGDFRILSAYLGALRAARRLVYIENQFLWSPEVAAVLRDKLARPPEDGFRIVCVLPSKPNNGGDDTRGMLAELIDADAGAGRILACTLYARADAHADPIYVHAKAAVVDDTWMTIGSANLNEHSLFNDTEMNIVTRDPGVIRQTRLRLWAEHLESSPDRLEGDATEIIENLWKPISAEQLARWNAHRPLTHRLMGLPQLSRSSERILGPFQGLIVDG